MQEFYHQQYVQQEKAALRTLPWVHGGNTLESGLEGMKIAGEHSPGDTEWFGQHPVVSSGAWRVGGT